MTVPTTKLQIWTADSTNITCDTINFTCDGACLVNGGGTAIQEAPKGASFNQVSNTRVTQLPN
jgi:hypothetical protein